jgi:fucose 4-O-acetylase-like acetyltransferase
MTSRDHTGDGQPVSGDLGDSGDATAAEPRSELAGPPDDLALGRTERPAGAETKRRNEALDVLKAVLIIIVVFGHLVEHFSANDPYYRAWYAAISLFTIPLFTMLSGMFAGPLLSDAVYRKLFARLLLPLICLQPFYLVLIQLYQGDAVHHLLDPQWMLWFLLSLCCWRLMMPLFLRIPAALTVSVGITLAAGYAAYIGPDLSLSRTLYFFPFFLAGYLWRQKILDLVARARLLWGVLFVALMAGVVVWSLHGLDQAVFYGSESYDKAAVWSAQPALGRLALLLMSALALLSLMAIAPRKSRWLARIGRRTLTIFVLHGFPVLVCYKVFNIAGWSTPSPALTPVFVVLAVGIAWVLSGLDGPFNRFFDWLAARLSRRI